MNHGGSSNWTVPTVRLLAIAIAALFALCGIAAVIFARSGSAQADFLSFWAAGHLAVGGHPSAAYDLAQHRAVEVQAVPGVGVLPFPYPPPFLLALLPFGLAPYWIAFAAWIALTAALYLVASRRIIEPRFSFAQAAAGANFITGQNGFLTSAIFIGGTSLLESRPFIGGAMLGLLCLKPQLAILLPVALLAGREWRAIGGGIVSGVAMLLIALVAFGMDSYRGFLALLPQFAEWLSAERWPLGELASTFAMLRSFGVPAAAAMAIHGAVALAATALTARAWALKLETRIPILAAATLLITPYLLTYDALVLSLPLAWLLRDSRNHWRFVAVWVATLVPAVSYFTAVPNVIPLAAIIALWGLHRPGERTQPYQV
jgi:hypothetical protein